MLRFDINCDVRDTGYIALINLHYVKFNTILAMLDCVITSMIYSVRIFFREGSVCKCLMSLVLSPLLSFVYFRICVD